MGLSLSVCSLVREGCDFFEKLGAEALIDSVVNGDSVAVERLAVFEGTDCEMVEDRIGGIPVRTVPTRRKSTVVLCF